MPTFSLRPFSTVRRPMRRCAARILGAAEGNPLFVEEMVALVRASPGGPVAVPPTIQALLAARLDQLDPLERIVLERGSVEGRVFHRGAVQALSPDEAELLGPLTALVRRELLRSDRPQFPGEDAFRFRHLLIRDAAYDGLPKATRAKLHERFATGSSSAVPTSSSWTRSSAITLNGRTATSSSSVRRTTPHCESPGARRAAGDGGDESGHARRYSGGDQFARTSRRTPPN